MSLQVEKITSKEALESAFAIRQEVFVVEQEVAPEEEYDEYEDTSVHFLATLDGRPAGTARWRVTANGIKLERFAVLKEVRGKGVGQALVAAVLADIALNPDTKEKIKYLHAQLTAIPLYEKFDFKKVGDIFEECNIKHYKMQLA